MSTDNVPIWPEVLAAPAYVVNLDRRPERLSSAVRELRAAGISSITRFAAVDGADRRALQAGWQAWGSPKLSDAWEAEPERWAGQQGCLLSHLLLWEHIARGGDRLAWVFEDDIRFAGCWSTLAPTYYDRSRSPWDILFVGSHAWVDLGQAWVVRAPVYCTHAYLITRSGAWAMAAALRSRPAMYAVDMMIADLQQLDLRGEARAGFDWLVWHGQHHHRVAEIGATGLVLQHRHHLPSDVGSG